MQKIFIFTALFFLLIPLANQSFAQTEEKLVMLETSLGNIIIEFFPEDAPNHVENFINLTESGFYDGVLFHRIIPGFMIQGGDPNTKNPDNITWGTGGPEYSIDAEFNSIKHDRGIVSMARSQNPNSAGSQFFIVHQNSNFLDQQYTVFGRIVTQESFDTLDKIAAQETGARDIPLNIDDVKIIKATTLNRSEVPDLLDLGEPERVNQTMETSDQPFTSSGTQMFEHEQLDVGFNVAEGWTIQEPPKTDEHTPDIVAIGPQTGLITPVISLRIFEDNGQTFDEFIEEKNELIKEAVDANNLEVISQEKFTINGKEAYVTNAIGTFETNDQVFEVKFKETTIAGPDKFYTFAYSNGIDDFDNQLPIFEDSLNSFNILSEPTTTENTTNEGGGCLIATATYGSELAPQVQQLRELRDNTILQTQTGSSFMGGFNQIYYTFSPTIADFERENYLFKETIKLTLTPMLSSLSILNHVNIDSEEEMLGYGVSLILLNIGIYFGIPATIIYKIRK